MYYSKIWVTCYETNSLDAFVPEFWAMEGVAILVENMVASTLVHRDFEPLFQSAGDVVNTRKPGEFTAKRKGVREDVIIQDSTATNIPVPLDQHVHTSFLIRDGEEAKSFKSLVDEYLNPAAISLARFVDQIVLGQFPRFIQNQAGTIGGLTSANAVQYITETGLAMDLNNAHQTGRNLIWTPEAQSLLVQNPTFHQADRVGDDGSALRDASIGRKLNFQHWMGQNMKNMDGLVARESAVINAGLLTKGSTVITVDAGSIDAISGAWLSINGKVYHAITGALTTGAGDITLEYGLVEDIADDDAVIIYPNTNLVDGAEVIGFDGFIQVDDGAGADPELMQVGQMVTFGTTATDRYTIIEIDLTGSATEHGILLDRPLAAALADNATVNYGPDGGGMNLAFHRNAMTLVIRPLQPPRSGAGAVSAVSHMGGATMRVTITYDGDKQGHLVTLDFLAGIAILDTGLGAVTLS